MTARGTMPLSDSDSHLPVPRSNWKRGLVGVVAFLGLTIGLVVLVFYLRFANPEYVRATAEAYIQQFTNGRVHVGSADFTWLGGVQLYDVIVRDSKRDAGQAIPGAGRDTDEVVFSCKDLQLDANLLWGVLGKLRIRTVVADEPTCLIVRRASDGSTNLTDLLKWGSDETRSEELSLPTIELRNAHVRVVHRQNDRDRVVDEQTLTVRGRPSGTDPRFYDIVWRGGGARRAQGHSQVDVQSGRLRNISGGLPWMSLEAVMTVVNAQNPEVGAWSDLLGLKGAVRAIDYDFSGGSAREEPRSATVELEDATLSIPITDEEIGLPLDERYLRFKRVFGNIKLTAQGIAARFNATFHGGECDVTLSMKGAVEDISSLDDVDFSVQVNAKNLELPVNDLATHPAHHRFVQRWAPIKKFYRDFQPSGVVDLEMEVEKRAGADAPVETKNIRLIAKNVGATYRKFPYPVEHLEGVVDFTPDGVFIRDLRGRHGEGLIGATGWLSAPRRHAAVDLTISGAQVLIDDALIDALPPGYRRIHELFAPVGRIDATVHMRREASEEGESKKWYVSTDVGFEQLAAMYRGFPVQARELHGKLRVDGTKLEIRGLEGVMAGGRVTLSGNAQIVSGAMQDLSLSLAGRGMELTDSVTRVLPERVRRWVTRFHPAGPFGVDMTFQRVDGVLSYETSIDLDGMSVSNEELPIPVGDVRGTLRLRNGRIEAENVTGRYHDARLSVNAGLAGEGGAPEDFISVACTNLTIDDPLRAAVPEGIRALLETWRVQTPLDVDVTVRRGSDDVEPWRDVDLVAHLKDATVQHERFPLPFERVTAEVRVDGSGVAGSGIRASYGDADVEVSFHATNNGGVEEGRLDIDTRGLMLIAPVRDVFPENVRRAWDRLGLKGSADVHLHPLVYRRAARDADAVWTAKGTVDLSNVDPTRVTSIGGVHGKLNVDGTLVDRLGGMMVGGTFEDGRLTIFDREITNVSTPWTHVQVAEGQGRFLLDDIRGAMYGGSFTARTEIHFDDKDTRYDVRGAIHGVDVKRVLAVDRNAASVKPSRHEVAGVADASLTLVGTVGKPPSRKGTGRIEVRDAQLFHMPLISAVLNVINLSLPTGELTDYAEASFYVLGSRLKLEDIYFEGHGLAFVGSGTLSLPDKGLDLNLVYMNANQSLRVPGLSDAVESAIGNIVELHVTGPIHQPRVVPRALPGISEELKRLFKKKKPKKMQATSR